MITMAGTIIFDRLDWYADNSEVFEQARERFAVILKWLAGHHMLNPEGIEVAQQPISDEFSLSSSLLTSDGIKFLSAHYEKWLFNEGVSDPISTAVLDDSLAQ